MGHKNDANERKKKDRNQSEQDKGVERGVACEQNTIEEGGGGEEQVLSSLLLLEKLTSLFRRRSSETGAKRHFSKQYVPR